MRTETPRFERIEAPLVAPKGAKWGECGYKASPPVLKLRRISAKGCDETAKLLLECKPKLGRALDSGGNTENR